MSALSFDDLIPASAPGASSLSFDDLIPPEKRKVGVGESLVRGAKDALYSVPQLVNTGLEVMPTIVDAAAVAVGLEPKVRERWQRLMVAPAQAERAEARIDPATEEQGMAAQIASTAGPLVRDAGLALLTGAAAPATEAAAGTISAIRALIPQMTQGAAAMAVPAGIAGMDVQNAARAAGASETAALLEGAAATAKVAAMGAVPLAASSGGTTAMRRFAERTMKAFPLVAGQNEAVHAAEALARGEPYQFDPQRMVVESLPMTVIAGAAGARTPAKPRGETLKSFTELPDDIVPPAQEVLPPARETPPAPPVPYMADPAIPHMVKLRAEETLRAAGLAREEIHALDATEAQRLLEAARQTPPRSAPESPAVAIAESAPPAARPQRAFTAEELAQREYEDNLLREGRAVESAGVFELREAIADAGGFPSKSSPHRADFAGEIGRIEDAVRNPQRREKLEVNKLFRADAPPIDELATRLRDRGFQIDDPRVLFDFAEDRFRTGREQFGRPAVSATGDPFGFGPGAASAGERVAQYQKRAFGERFQKDYRIAQELRENTGNRYYEPIPNKITAEEALTLVESRSIADTVNAIRDEASGLPFHIRATMGQQLLKRLNQAFHNLREDDPAAADVVLNHAVDTSDWLSEFGTRLGQGVQAFSMWNRLTPEGKLISLQRTAKKARDRYTAAHGDEVADILKPLNTDGMTDAERLAELKKLFKTNATARKVKPFLQKLIETAKTGRMTDQQFYEIAAERLGLPKWDKDVAAQIARMAAKIENAPEGAPRNNASYELATFIEKQKGFASSDLPLGIYYANMLSGYNTQIVNGLDTFLNVTSELNGLAITNPRAAARIYSNALRGFLDGKLDFINALSKGRMVTQGKWLEAPKLLDIAEFGRKGGVPINVTNRRDAVLKAVAESRPAAVLNGWKYVGRLMAATDAFMYRGAYEARVALTAERLARTEGLKGRALDARVEEIIGRDARQQHRFEEQARAEGFTGREFAMRVAELRDLSRGMDARADAADFAGLATYNHDPQGWIGVVANTVGNLSNKYPLLKVFVPFTRIVANVTNRGLNYTPLGFKRAFYGYERGDTVTADQRNAMLARATMGTLGMTTLMSMQAAGLLEINGAGPKDPERRKQLTAAGWKPYSLRIGDQYWSYVYTPIGLGMAVLGNVSDSYRYQEMDEKSLAERAGYAMSRIGSTIFSQSFLSGFSNLFQSLSGRTEQAIPALKNTIATTVGTITTPRIILDVQRWFDPRRFESSTLQGDLLRNTPFAALTNKPALNAFGEPTMHPTNRFVSALSIDPAWQMVVRKNLRVPVPAKDTDMPDGRGGMRRITPEEYYELLETSGKRIKEHILKYRTEFGNADTEQAQEALSAVAQQIRGAELYKIRARIPRQ